MFPVRRSGTDWEIELKEGSSRFTHVLIYLKSGGFGSIIGQLCLEKELKMSTPNDVVKQIKNATRRKFSAR